jgi:alternate signal-mediated exported protein
MKKVVKATIAAAAAVALFGGGAGSLAFWQASSSTEALTLQMGHVEIRSGAKTYTLNGETKTDSELSGNRLVPGDVVTYQQDFMVDIGGTDAVLSVPELDFGTTAPAVLDAIETELAVGTVSGQTDYLNFSETTDARKFNVTGFGGVRVTISITVPAELEDTSSMVQGIFLNPLPVTVTQVAEPLPAPLYLG